jgi:hypothetical protein
MDYLVTDGVNSVRKGACVMMSPSPQSIVMGHSVHLCLHPFHRRLEQLLALLNAIVQKLAAIEERQAGQSQPHQQS